MELIDSILVPRKNGNAKLELLNGDLSEMPPEHKVDILVISAFPNDYHALPGSLMLSLKEKGLLVEDLAKDKAADLRSSIGCWFSKPLSAAQQELFNFRQILCFEPGMPADDPESVVGNIFRCLNTFAFDAENRSIAMPVIASGYQSVPFETMLPALIEAGLFWLDGGLPIDVIKIVIHSQERSITAQKIITRYKREFGKSNANSEILPASAPQAEAPPTSATPKPALKKPVVKKAVTIAAKSNAGQVQNSSLIAEKLVQPLPTSTHSFDYFISYAHTQSEPVDHFVKKLLTANPGLKIFYDKSSIPKGSRWLKDISDAIAKTKKVIMFMSPDYSASMICWDEFQCAKLQEYKTGSDVILGIYLSNDPNLPPMMGIHNYIDCREADLEKLVAACDELSH